MDSINIILELLKQPKKTQVGLARHIGLQPSNLNKILNRQENRQFKSEQMALIANYFDVSTDYLYGLETNIQQKVIPLIGKSSCGKPKDYDLNGYEPVPVPLDMYKDGMYAVEAEGDSMKPKINDGDIVYCQPNRIIDNGNIVHYWLDGESGIKKYKMNEAGTIISLIPINSDYEVITIHCDDKHELIMGRVVGKIDRDF
jgi:repressor LexA